MRQFAVVKNTGSDELFAIIVKDESFIVCHGVHAAGKKWAEDYNQGLTKSVYDGLHPEISVGQFAPVTSSMQSLINEATEGKSVRFPDYSQLVYVESVNYFHDREIPQVKDAGLSNLKDQDYFKAVNYKGAAFRADAARLSVLAKSRLGRFGVDAQGFNFTEQGVDQKALNEELFETGGGYGSVRRAVKEVLLEKGLNRDAHPGFYHRNETQVSFHTSIETKRNRLGRRIGGGASGGIRKIGRSMRDPFDPNAWDGDGDGLVQEGTAWERPSIPGVNTNLPGMPKTRTKPREYAPDNPARVRQPSARRQARRSVDRNRSQGMRAQFRGMESERYDIAHDSRDGKWHVVDTGNRNMRTGESFDNREEALAAAVAMDRGNFRRSEGVRSFRRNSSLGSFSNLKQRMEDEGIQFGSDRRRFLRGLSDTEAEDAFRDAVALGDARSATRRRARRNEVSLESRAVAEDYARRFFNKFANDHAEAYFDIEEGEIRPDLFDNWKPLEELRETLTEAEWAHLEDALNNWGNGNTGEEGLSEVYWDQVDGDPDNLAMWNPFIEEFEAEVSNANPHNPFKFREPENSQGMRSRRDTLPELPDERDRETFDTAADRRANPKRYALPELPDEIDPDDDPPRMVRQLATTPDGKTHAIDVVDPEWLKRHPEGVDAYNEAQRSKNSVIDDVNLPDLPDLLASQHNPERFTPEQLEAGKAWFDEVQSRRMERSSRPLSEIRERQSRGEGANRRFWRKKKDSQERKKRFYRPDFKEDEREPVATRKSRNGRKDRTFWDKPIDDRVEEILDEDRLYDTLDGYKIDKDSLVRQGKDNRYKLLADDEQKVQDIFEKYLLREGKNRDQVRDANRPLDDEERNEFLDLIEKSDNAVKHSEGKIDRLEEELTQLEGDLEYFRSNMTEENDLNERIDSMNPLAAHRKKNDNGELSNAWLQRNAATQMESDEMTPMGPSKLERRLAVEKRELDWLEGQVRLSESNIDFHARELAIMENKQDILGAIFDRKESGEKILGVDRNVGMIIPNEELEALRFGMKLNEFKGFLAKTNNGIGMRSTRSGGDDDESNIMGGALQANVTGERDDAKVQKLNSKLANLRDNQIRPLWDEMREAEANGEMKKSRALRAEIEKLQGQEVALRQELGEAMGFRREQPITAPTRTERPTSGTSIWGRTSSGMRSQRDDDKRYAHMTSSELMYFEESLNDVIDGGAGAGPDEDLDLIEELRDSIVTANLAQDAIDVGTPEKANAYIDTLDRIRMSYEEERNIGGARDIQGLIEGIENARDSDGTWTSINLEEQGMMLDTPRGMRSFRRMRPTDRDDTHTVSDGGNWQGERPPPLEGEELREALRQEFPGISDSDLENRVTEYNRDMRFAREQREDDLQEEEVLSTPVGELIDSYPEETAVLDATLRGVDDEILDIPLRDLPNENLPVRLDEAGRLRTDGTSFDEENIDEIIDSIVPRYGRRSEGMRSRRDSADLNEMRGNSRNKGWLMPERNARGRRLDDEFGGISDHRMLDEWAAIEGLDPDDRGDRQLINDHWGSKRNMEARYLRIMEEMDLRYDEDEALVKARPSAEDMMNMTVDELLNWTDGNENKFPEEFLDDLNDLDGDSSLTLSELGAEFDDISTFSNGNHDITGTPRTDSQLAIQGMRSTRSTGRSRPGGPRNFERSEIDIDEILDAEEGRAFSFPEGEGFRADQYRTPVGQRARSRMRDASTDRASQSQGMRSRKRGSASQAGVDRFSEDDGQIWEDLTEEERQRVADSATELLDAIMHSLAWNDIEEGASPPRGKKRADMTPWEKALTDGLSRNTDLAADYTDPETGRTVVSGEGLARAWFNVNHRSRLSGDEVKEYIFTDDDIMNLEAEIEFQLRQDKKAGRPPIWGEKKVDEFLDRLRDLQVLRNMRDSKEKDGVDAFRFLEQLTPSRRESLYKRSNGPDKDGVKGSMSSWGLAKGQRKPSTVGVPLAERQANVAAQTGTRRRVGEFSRSMAERIWTRNEDNAARRALRRARRGGAQAGIPGFRRDEQERSAIARRIAATKRKFRTIKGRKGIQGAIDASEKKQANKAVGFDADGKLLIGEDGVARLGLAADRLLGNKESFKDLKMKGRGGKGVDKAKDGDEAFELLNQNLEMAVIWDAQGMNELPVLVNEDSLNDLIDSGGYVVGRGHGSRGNATDYLDDELRFLPGTGGEAYGKGEYWSNQSGSFESWQQLEGGNTVAVLTPNVRRITTEDLEVEASSSRKIANAFELVKTDYTDELELRKAFENNPKEIIDLMDAEIAKIADLADGKPVWETQAGQLWSHLLDSIRTNGDPDSLMSILLLEKLNRTHGGKNLLAPILGYDTIKTGGVELVMNRSALVALDKTVGYDPLDKAFKRAKEVASERGRK